MRAATDSDLAPRCVAIAFRTIGRRSGGSSHISSERPMPRITQGRITGRAVNNAIPSPAGGVALETFVPWTLVKRGVKQEVITPIEVPEPPDVANETRALRALGLAHYWQHLLDSGEVEYLREIAAAEDMDRGQVSRISRLAWPGPGVVVRATQRRLDLREKNPQHRINPTGAVMEEVPRPLRERKPLPPHWHLGQHVIQLMRGRLGHAPGAARWADDRLLSGEGNQKVMIARRGSGCGAAAAAGSVRRGGPEIPAASA